MGFIDIAFRRPPRHQALNQQQCPSVWESFATISQDYTAALVVPIVNYALEDDRIGEVRDHFEEIAGDKFCTIDNSEALKMFVRSIGASWKIKHSTKKLRIFSSYGADQFTRPASDVHEMGNVSKIIRKQDGRRDQSCEIGHRGIKFFYGFW